MTVIALPLLLAEGRSNSAERPPAVAAVGLAGELSSGANPTSPTTAAAPATDAVSSPTASAATTVIEIGVRAPLPATTTTGKAGFKRWVGGGSCSTEVVPTGTRLTVTNLDNGQATTCVNSQIEGNPAWALVTLRTDTFQRIGDLAQAPVPVRITWEQ